MGLILNIIFWLSIAALFHTYVFYGLLMRFLAKGKTLNQEQYSKEDKLPPVHILMAAYNEEQVLADKLESIFQLDYPSSKISVYVGSDNSSDQTNEILKDYSSRYSNLYPTFFNTRQGKPSIINQLVELTKENSEITSQDLYLMTDASVMLDSSVLFNLVRHFKNEKVGLVDAHMTYIGMQEQGISKSENTYLNSEVALKQNESKQWGQMIGPFGGCFALRAELYAPVPNNFLVDDFYLSMKVLDKGYLVFNDLEALCYEPVSHASSEEFRRKKRISTGNFQNLSAFSYLLNPFRSLGFAFISHKVLRWLGPFFMIAVLVISFLFARTGSLFYKVILGLQLVWYIAIPLADILLTQLRIHLPLIRNVSYFNLMNYALLRGFFSFLFGVKSGVWQPTKRT